MDEISQLKREKELLERSIVNKDAEIIDIHKQCETSSSAARTADNKIRLLESQVTSSAVFLLTHTELLALVHCVAMRLNFGNILVALGHSIGAIGWSCVLLLSAGPPCGPRVGNF